MGEVIAENTEQRYLETDQEYNKRVLDTARIITALTGLATGQEADDINTAVDTATNAVINNYLAHNVRLNLEKANKDCANGVEVACSARDYLKKLDKDSYLTKEDREYLSDYSNFNNEELKITEEWCFKYNICTIFDSLHTKQRENWNSEANKEFIDNPQKFIKTPWYINLFHGFSSDKYIDKESGQLEVIVDKKTGKIVTNEHKGTYNYYPPSNLWGHTFNDFLPWWRHGNERSN